jgi:hypothetical protein
VLSVRCNGTNIKNRLMTTSTFRKPFNSGLITEIDSSHPQAVVILRVVARLVGSGNPWPLDFVSQRDALAILSSFHKIMQ